MAQQPSYRKKSTSSIAVGMTVMAFSFPVPMAYAQTVIGSGTTVSVPGDYSSPWFLGGSLAVNGTVNVENGGEITSNGWGYIGSNAGDAGTVTVDGAGSSWTSAGVLYVGDGGKGDLVISNGGSVVNTDGRIGYSSGASGTVSVDGADSSWENRGHLYVGDSGDGSLAISNGGTVSNQWGYIGFDSGSSGEVTVTGAGSTWENSSNLFIGLSGEGTLAISDGGSVSNTFGYIGQNAGSTGTVSVDGAGSSWENSGDLYVGNLGDGTLDISNGGSVSNVWGFIGYDTDSTGAVSVDGAGSSWENSDRLYVGYTGEGTLDISNGGSVSSTEGIVGRSIDGTGKVSVTGAGSSWENSGHLHVGFYGNGTVDISDGGLVSNTNGYIGHSTGSTGTVNVAGAGSAWENSGDLYVGRRGDGSLAISDGGRVSSTVGYIGYDTTAGAVSVDGSGSLWENSDELFVGYYGKGTLDITNGGTVSTVTGIIGRDNASSGVVNVDGSGSLLKSSDYLYVGNYGSGTLNITNGGQVNPDEGFIGVRASGMGTVSVDGAGSTWSSNTQLTVGYEGNGRLDVSNSGSVSNTNGFIGYASGSLGAANIDGAGSTWANSGILYVGTSGNGTLAISNDGLVSVDREVTLALNSGSTGALDLASGGTLQTLALAAGDGTAAATFDGGILRAIADNAGFITGFAPGTLVLDTDGLLIDSNGHDIATDDSAFSGIGGLTKTGSGTLTLMGANDYSGTTTVAAGRLMAGDVDVFSPNSAFEIMTGATLDLDGYDQSLAALSNSGSVAMGATGSATPVGTTLNVSGNYESNGGALSLRTVLGDDSSASDRLVVGNATTGAGGATKLYVTNVGGLGAATANGIEVVQVNTSSSSDAFELGRAVTAGAYEYVLDQPSGQSWYLTSRNGSLLNPNIGSVLGNQYAAATMFAHNILDRRESVRSADQTLWIRARHSALNTDLLDGRQHADIRTSVVQIGADLIRYGDIVAGLFGGYGHSSIDNRSNQTGTKADGSVDGTSIGLYASWMPDENTGPYADVWGMYAWYDNEIKGQAQNRTTKYDSSGYTLSAEAGYGFTLGTESGGRSWILKPHAQLSYVSIDADSFRDSHGTWYNDSQGSGIQSRLGARLHGAGKGGFFPFVELNWLYNDVDNAVRLDGIKASNTIGRNVGELKAGLTGKISESVSVWGHLGAQRGSEGFERYEVQIGLGWQW